MLNNKNIKHIILVFLTTIFIGSQPFVIFGFLKNQQYTAYKEMRKIIKSNKIKNPLTLSIPCFSINKSLRWKNNHEFYKDGFICDVINYKKEKNQIIIQYIIDKKETKIENSIKKIHKNKGNKKIPPKINAYQLLLFQNNHSSSLNYYVDLDSILKQRISLNYKSIILNLPNPPPKA